MPYVAYRNLAEAGRRYIDIPALHGRDVARRASEQETFDPPEGPRQLGELRTIATSVAGVFRECASDQRCTVAAVCVLLVPGQADSLRRRLEHFAHEFGAQSVIADATTQTIYSKDVERQLLDRLREQADHAAERGIRLALEMTGVPTRNDRMAAEFQDAVEHSNVGVNDDTGNIDTTAAKASIPSMTLPAWPDEWPMPTERPRPAE